MAAEIDKLTIQEKELIVKTVIDEVDDRVPVIAGVSSDTQAERLLLSEKFVALGCDGIMVNIDFKSETNFKKHLYKISTLQPEFLMIQDWDNKGYGLPINVIKILFEEIDCFKCLKIEVVPAGVKYTKVLSTTNDKLHVSGGWAGNQMIEALDRRVDAFMPTVLPGIYNKIFWLHRSGKRKKAKHLFYKLLPILAFSHQHIDISIHFNKKLVHRQGLFSTDNVREPILDFDQNHKIIAQELIREAISLQKSLT
jgi:4-hydroxy-tetrahydrodipicolinate synthase